MKQYSREELEELLRTANPAFAEAAPSSDALAKEIEKISPYLKIRLLPIGYFSDDEGNPKPSSEEERWGSTIKSESDSSEYHWCGSLWTTLAISYLKILKHIE